MPEKQTTDRYRLLLENMNDAFVYLQANNYSNYGKGKGQTKDFIVTDANEAFAQLANANIEDILNQKFTSIFSKMHQEDSDLLETLNKTLITTKTARTEEYFNVLEKWFDITAFSDGYGHVGIIFRDITEIKQSQGDILTYKQMVENLNEVIYILDTNATITYVSPNVIHFGGYTPEELMQQQFTGFVHPDDLEGRITQFKKVLSGIIEPSEYRFIEKSGNVKWVRTSARPIIKNGQVVGVQGVLTDITDLKQAEESLRYMSFHDTLTGLYNRFYLEKEMQRLDTPRQLPISLIMIDMNGLKLINDIYGHQTGDEVLKKVADTLQKSCRQEEIIARYGGDEFVIFLPQTDMEGVQTICNRIKEKCHNVAVEDVPVLLSLGYSTKTKSEKNLYEVLSEAEDNMYKQKLSEKRSSQGTLLNAFFEILEAKKYETTAHAMHMQMTAFKIGEKLKLNVKDLNRLEQLITMHDIGKINIADYIFHKKGSLSFSEWKLIKKHPETGYRIARITDDFSPIAEEILTHHEHWNGQGYPQGLKGKEIPLLSRIAAIADAYEVMKSGRPYKAAMSTEKIAAEFRRCAGTQFDPELVEIFLSILEQETTA